MPFKGVDAMDVKNEFVLKSLNDRLVFTATATEYYIHFNPGTLSQVLVQVYDNTGSAIGEWTSLYSNLNTSLTVTSDSEYYIRVRPNPASDSVAGAYKIAFNASTTPPQ